MSVKIESAGLSKLVIASLLNFAKEVSFTIEESGIEVDKGSKVKETYESFKENYHISANPYGTSLKEIDDHVDLFWRGSRAILKTNLKHPDAAARALAAEIYNVFQEHGDLSKLSRKKEYGVIDALLEKLNKYSEDQLKWVGIDRWIAALKGAFEEFFAKSHAKTVDSETGIAKRSRDEFIAAYNAFVERMNALSVLMPDDAHDALATRINAVIAKFRIPNKKKNGEEEGDGKAKDSDNKSAETAASDALSTEAQPAEEATENIQTADSTETTDNNANPEA